MKAIYNKNTGQVLMYVDNTTDVDAVKSNWPGVADFVVIDSVPSKQQLGQWHINLQTLELEKIA
jgi:hypothetical protein